MNNNRKKLKINHVYAQMDCCVRIKSYAYEMSEWHGKYYDTMLKKKQGIPLYYGENYVREAIKKDWKEILQNWLPLRSNQLKELVFILSENENALLWTSINF